MLTVMAPERKKKSGHWCCYEGSINEHWSEHLCTLLSAHFISTISHLLVVASLNILFLVFQKLKHSICVCSCRCLSTPTFHFHSCPFSAYLSIFLDTLFNSNAYLSSPFFPFVLLVINLSNSPAHMHKHTHTVGLNLLMPWTVLAIRGIDQHSSWLHSQKWNIGNDADDARDTIYGGYAGKHCPLDNSSLTIVWELVCS